MRPLLAAAVAGLALAPQSPPAGLLAQEPVVAGVRTYYAPGAGIESVDARLIASAKTSIDMAAYVLTDRALIFELGRAAMRGVHVRVYLDGEQMGRSESAILQIAATPNVELRQKRRSRDPMHLKSFVVDNQGLAQRLGQFQRVGRGLSGQRPHRDREPSLGRKLHRKFRAAVGARRQSADRRQMTRASVMVLGAGAWGVALANVAAFERDHVALWGHDPEHVAALARDRENRRHLPGLPLAAAVAPTADLAELERRRDRAGRRAGPGDARRRAAGAAVPARGRGLRGLRQGHRARQP